MRKQKRIVEGIETETSSGSNFADLVCRMPKLKIKSGLVIEIIQAVRKLDLTQKEASCRMGIPQPQVSALLRGDFTGCPSVS